MGHGRQRTLVRDLPVAGRPTVLCWFKRRWCCVDVDCAMKTWTETNGEVAPRAVLSERARERLGHRGRKHDPLYRVRRVLLTGYERLSDDRFEWMRRLLDAGADG